MKNHLKTFAILLMIVVSTTTYSQNKWSVEFRPDLNFPTGDFGASKLGTGYGFELTASYAFVEYLSAYAGWSYNTFNVETTNFDLDETGFTFGLQFIHSLGSSETLSYLLRAGGTYNQIALKNTEGDTVSDSKHGLGYQMEAGITYDLGTNWELRPTMRYSVFSSNLDIENTTMNVDLNYLSFGLGIAKTF